MMKLLAGWGGTSGRADVARTAEELLIRQMERRRRRLVEAVFSAWAASFIQPLEVNMLELRYL